MQTSASKENDYDPNDLESVENFWEGARIEHKGKTIGFSHRINQTESANTKVKVTLNLSPNVLQYFKNTGDDWQTRLNEALLEYVATHR